MRLTQGSPTALSLKSAIDDRKLTRLGEPEARRDSRVADSRGVLMTRGRLEAVDERWQWSHGGAVIVLRGKDQKTTRGDRISDERYPYASA